MEETFDTRSLSSRRAVEHHRGRKNTERNMGASTAEAGTRKRFRLWCKTLVEYWIIKHRNASPQSRFKGLSDEYDSLLTTLFLERGLIDVDENLVSPKSSIGEGLIDENEDLFNPKSSTQRGLIDKDETSRFSSKNSSVRELEAFSLTEEDIKRGIKEVYELFADSFGLSEGSTKFKPKKFSDSTDNVSAASEEEYISFEDICELLPPQFKIPGEFLLIQSLYCAKEALSHYNTKHGTDYKLVEPLASGRCSDHGLRFHCNFRAAKVGKRPKLFFADFRVFRARIRDIHCCTVDPDKVNYNCCEYCPPELAHCAKANIKFRREMTLEETAYAQGVAWAGNALEFYNKKHGTEYVVVEPLAIRTIQEDRFSQRYHCNFRAKIKKPCNSDDDASPKLFFADYVVSYTTKYVECCILDTAESLDDHCWFCEGRLLHPAEYRSQTVKHNALLLA